MVRGRVFFAAAVIACVCAGIVGCNALLGLGNYRGCEGAECDASTAGDGPPLGIPCQTSADCVQADAGLLCSQGNCASVTQLARGMSNFECVVLSDGTARCWGANKMAQLGNGVASATNVATPQVVLDETGKQPMTGIQQISLGFDFACAVRLVGGNTGVWCWGLSQGGGSLATPQPISLGNSTVKSLSAANDSACALVAENSTNHNDVWCWGVNTNGKLGCNNASSCTDGGPDPNAISLQIPQKLVSAASPGYLANGLYALCIAFPGQGTVDCRGTDGWGNLGDGVTANSCCAASSPAPVLPSTVVQLQGADFYTCAQDDSLDWFCWGGNLGEGCPLLNGCGDLHQPTPLDIGAGNRIVDLSPGWRHMCGITQSGTSVWCWGQDDHGQVGNGKPPQSGAVGPTQTALPAPAQPAALIAAHRHFTCVLGHDGQVYCWGQNGDQNDATPWLLGVGSPSGDVLSPQPVVWE